MNVKRTIVMGMALTAMLLRVPLADAARKGKAEKAPLTEKGAALNVQYTAEMELLKKKIVTALPDVDKRAIEAYNKAIEAEMQSKEALAEAKKAFGQIGHYQGLVSHAKGKWIGGAEKGIAKAKAKLEKANTDAERAEAQKELENWEQNLAAGQAALQERQAGLDQAKADEPRLKRALEAAEAALAQAIEHTIAAVAALELDAFLSADDLDEAVAQYVIMKEATPEGLARFAQQGKKHEALVRALFSDEDLMVQILVADGAAGGEYGRAMQIYSEIQDKSKRARKGELQRLALAISLELAEPIAQRNPNAATDAPTHVDPVKRYMHYEKAYVGGELDAAFKDLSVWDYRMVVDGSEPDETLAWGREMLRAYRPDHITNPDYKWRYVGAVRTEIRYGSQYNKFDKDELQFFQNILMNGGICGRRAFFGRFILRAFGIPTTARPQSGHAALVHWTPVGWVVNLGAGWGSGWTKGRYNKDLNFLATTQAREADEAFMKVKRAQWIGDVMGEKPVYGFVGAETLDFWYGVSLYVQKGIIADLDAKALAAEGEELGEANESDVEYETDEATVTDADRKITIGKGGVITIPAVATQQPTKSTGKILFMNSFGGDGKQLHYNRTGKPETFTYEIEAPVGGAYQLSAQVACPSFDQILLVHVNDAKEPTEIALPLTTGLWGTVAPVEITLVKGKNTLTFSRGGDDPHYIRGLTIKAFTLTPVK